MFGAWPLRFELVNHLADIPDTDPAEWPLQTHSYRVRAPIDAVLDIDPVHTLILQRSMDGVDRRTTAEECSDMLGRTIKPTLLSNYLRDMVYESGSKKLAEASCKAIVLGKVSVNVQAPELERVDKPKLALLAARGAGYEFEDMSFLSPMESNLRAHSIDTRKILGAPRYGSHPNLMARAFAAGALIIGDPYNSALVMPPTY